MPISHSPLPTTAFLYGLLADLLNQALTSDESGRARLAALDGIVVRIRAEKPAWALYLLIGRDGIELRAEHDGPVDVRLRGPLGAMLHWLFIADQDQPAESLRIQGASEIRRQLRDLAADFSLWTLVRSWFEEHVPMQALLDLLRREDPVWLTRLSALPDQVETLATQMARSQLLQEDILEEVRGLRREMRRARRFDLAFTLGGMILIALSLLRAFGNGHSVWLALSGDPLSLALISLGIALIAGRLVLRNG